MVDFCLYGFLDDSKCTENEFKCHRGPCIHQSMVCDGQLDCDLTWDDEDNNCCKILLQFCIE